MVMSKQWNIALGEQWQCQTLQSGHVSRCRVRMNYKRFFIRHFLKQHYGDFGIKLGLET